MSPAKRKRRRKGRRGAPPPNPLLVYGDASRRLSASLVFMVPLFAFYQVGLLLDDKVRNGTDPVFRELFDRARHLGMLVTNLLLLGLLLIAVGRTKARRRYVPGLYGFMFLESCLWTAFLLATGRLIARHVLPQLALPPLARDLFASAGAGIYEEVLFRLLLMGGLLLVLRRGLGGSAYWVVPLAAAASAVLFSLAHHELGGEPYDRAVFFYRAGLGFVLGLIYWARGLGIAAYSHALYNVALVLRSNA